MESRSFELFGEKWTLKYVDKIESDEEGRFYWGDCDPTKKIIRIATINSEGKPISKDEMHITLLHEIMHCICQTGMYASICSDEPFIEWSAKCLHKLIKSNII